MGATTEAHHILAEEYRASNLRKPLTLRRGSVSLSVETEGSVRFFESLSERRLLFGREQLAFYRSRAGILVQAQRPDWKVRVTPTEASLSSRLLDSIDVSQRIRMLSSARGYVRDLSLRNASTAQAKVRLVSLQDPTAAHFRDGSFVWGSLGVNAFNRSSHVALDEVADLPAARIIGSRPKPRLFYMTTDRGKAAELFQGGELPEQTAGMSGQVIVLAQHDFEIQPAGSAELRMLSVYDPTRLETALASFDRLAASEIETEGRQVTVACSSSGLSAASSWALSAVEGVQYENDLLDRYESLRVLPYVDPDVSRSILEGAKPSISREGSAGHSLDSTRPGLLETSLLLEGASLLGLLSAEKKLARSLYPTARKLAGYLLASSREGVVKADSSLPQGWRRKIGRGYPTGEIPEVSLSVASALSRGGVLASRAGKGKESALWEERSRVIIEAVKKRALDERGALMLCQDGERQRAEETVDQAVACYRLSPSSAVESHVIRRLLEKDFESGWGPRTVPTSNRIYFNPSYGDGQLGGYWTRAALAHAIAAYRAGLAGIGAIELELVSRLPVGDAAKMGGAPGDFPYWIDPNRREAHGPGSDPVAAARFLEALICCELGVEAGSGPPTISPARSSRLKWLLLSGLYLGRRTCVFLARAEGHAYVFAGRADCRIEEGWCFAGAEPAESDDCRVSAATFFAPGQTVCVGNSSETAVRARISFKPRDPVLSRHLSASLLQLEGSTGSWSKVSTVRILSPMSFEAALGPEEWRAFRVSTGS